MKKAELTGTTKLLPDKCQGIGDSSRAAGGGEARLRGVKEGHAERELAMSIDSG